MNKGSITLLFAVLSTILLTGIASAATCQGSWGDDGVTYPVPTSFSQFSDSDVVGLNCHLSGSQCPVPQVEGTCDTANQGFMECNIQVRDSSGTWTSIAKSTNGENCDFDDDAGSNFASVSNFMIDHNEVTDIRCKAFVYSYDATFDLCLVSAKGHDKRDDWWYNENTPVASNVVINPGTLNTLDDLNCDYTFSDADNDSENLSAVQYKWFVNDIDVGVNAATLGNNSTDVSDIVVCSVKVFDDVFVTGNEAFVNSTPVNISDANETPGTLPQRREMSLDFTDKVETSYVMNGRHRVVEISNDDKLYLHNDNVGSSSLKTKDNGEIDSEIITMPFGSQKADTGDGSSKSFFTGKETDNTGLQYFGSRYYDPSSGRFTQIDPIQRDSESNYWYANANPMVYVDPDGDHPAVFWAIRGAIALGSWAMSAISDPTFPEDVADLSSGIEDRDLLTVGFAAAGIVGPGGGRPAREGIEQTIETMRKRMPEGTDESVFLRAERKLRDKAIKEEAGDFAARKEFRVTVVQEARDYMEANNKKILYDLRTALTSRDIGSVGKNTITRLNKKIAKFGIRASVREGKAGKEIYIYQGDNLVGTMASTTRSVRGVRNSATHIIRNMDKEKIPDMMTLQDAIKKLDE